MKHETIQSRNKLGLCRCGRQLVTKTKCEKCRSRDNLLSQRLKQKRLRNGLCKCEEPLETARQCAKCRQQTNKRARILARKRKLTAIAHYGGCCRFCGEILNIFLTIDHIDGKGAEHRKKEKITTGTKNVSLVRKK